MLLALSREGYDVGPLGKSFCASQTWKKMVTFVYMGRLVNNLHCREDFWREDFLTYFIGKSFCHPFLWRLSGRNFYHTLLSARGWPRSAGRNSSPGPDFWKLFPYDYRLKWKYIHPCMAILSSCHLDHCRPRSRHNLWMLFTSFNCLTPHSVYGTQIKEWH